VACEELVIVLASHFDFAALQFGDWGAVVVSGSISRQFLLMPAYDSSEPQAGTRHVGRSGAVSQRCPRQRR
jgi:hypothetical protein